MYKYIYNNKKLETVYWTLIEWLNKSWFIYSIALLVDDFKMMPSNNV